MKYQRDLARKLIAIHENNLYDNLWQLIKSVFHNPNILTQLDHANNLKLSQRKYLHNDYQNEFFLS